MRKNGNVFIGIILVSFFLFGCPNPAVDEGGGGGGGSNTAPTAGSAITVGTVTETTIALSWGAATDAQTAQASLEYSVYRASTFGEVDTVSEAEAATQVMNWTANQLNASATGLLPDTEYYFAVVVRDGAGAKTLYSPVSGTTAADTTAPAVGSGITFTGTSANAVTVNWGAATDAVTAQASLEYKVVRAGTSAAIDSVAEANGAGPALVLDWSANTLSVGATGLTASTTYHFAVLVRDVAGNMGLYSPAPVTTSATADTTAPTVGTGPTFSNVANTTLIVNWNAASDNVTPVSGLEYKVVRAATIGEIDTVGEANGAGPALVLDWTANTLTANASGLTANTSYYFAVIVRDGAGNMSLYAPVQVTTTNVSDATAPTVGTAIARGTVSDTTVGLSWGAGSDNMSPPAQLQYKVVRANDTASIDTVNEADSATTVLDWSTAATSATATGLSNTNIYAFAVLVRDEAGNKALYTPILVETKPAVAYPHSTKVGHNRPQTGAFAAIDFNGDEPGRGWATQNWSLGARFVGNDLEIAVWSANAERILLELYDREHYWASKRIGSMPDSVHGQGHAVYDIWMEKGVDNIWRAKIANVLQYEDDGLMYAFRAWGPNWPWNNSWTRGNSTAGFISDVDATHGHRYNPNKLLHDPYALELTHDTEYPALATGGETGGMYGTGGSTSLRWDGVTSAGATYSGPIATNSVVVNRRNVDTGRFAPKGYALVIPAYNGTRPNVALKDHIIYESHVRGITKHPSSTHLTTILTNVKNVPGFEAFADVIDVPSQYRGTYKGAGMMAKYFKALGINAIEFVPVHETRNDMNDSFDGTGNNPGNYWGYMTYGFFAPDRNYSYDKSPGGPSAEFQEMVAAFAAEGIEVWIDVVYNHTGEGGTWQSPDVTGFNSFGGFDTANTYHLNPFDKRGIVDGATGVGNQVNFSRAQNRQMVIDSLTHWIDVLGVGGFRFDLAAVLGRDVDSHSPEPSATYWDRVKAFNTNFILLTSIASLGANRNVDMIAEAWDIWSYPVGQFPSGWGEWNGRYRDATRKFFKGTGFEHDGVQINDAFHGDYANFNDQGGPHKSINFIVAHDGFTLADLVSYNEKTNTARQWPFGPSDGGSSSNESWNSVITAGQYGLPTSEAFRRQRIRNFWVWQMFSRGAPMIVWGDEFARTQNGNNNPYNIDSVVTWSNYEFIGRDSPQTAPPQGSPGLSPLSTAGWSELNYHNNVGTDSKADGMNNLFLFSTAIMNLRRNEPALRQDNYNMGITYKKIDGVTDTAYDDRARMIRIDGDSVAGGSEYLLMVNMWETQLTYTVPAAPAGKVWKRIIDTAHWAESDSNSAVGNYWTGASTATISGTYGVNAWSIVVLKAE